MKTKKILLIGAAALGLIWLFKKKTSSGTDNGTTDGTGTSGGYYYLNGVKIYVSADPDNTLMYNATSGQTAWIPNSVVADYISGGWTVITIITS
jgi:hypothetical protein